MSGFASIYGSDHDETLVSSMLRQDDYIDGGAGNDTLIGLGGDDSLLGGLGGDLVLAGEGDDVAFGGFGADTLFGDAGNDTLSGEFGDNLLVGGAGNDVLMGGLIGNGHDSFAFDDGFGHDLIIGFQLGTDTLEIAGNINATGVLTAADVAAHVTADGSGNAVITLGSDTITLQGLSVADVTSNISSIVHIV